MVSVRNSAPYLFLKLVRMTYSVKHKYNQDYTIKKKPIKAKGGRKQLLFIFLKKERHAQKGQVFRQCRKTSSTASIKRATEDLPNFMGQGVPSDSHKEAPPTTKENLPGTSYRPNRLALKDLLQVLCS